MLRYDIVHWWLVWFGVDRDSVASQIGKDVGGYGMHDGYKPIELHYPLVIYHCFIEHLQN